MIGSGPNGLAAAITLARAGLEVEVHEAASTVGGGLRSAELTLPGFVHDICSSIHPLGRASPFFRELELDVEWVHPDAPAAHPFDDGTALLLERDPGATAAALGRDVAAYRRLVEPLVEAWREIERVLGGPFPVSPRAALDVRRRLGSRGLIRALRGSLAAARPLAEELFAEERTRGWFAGHSAHSMLPLERRPSAGFGLALIVLGHAVGWPFPRGGSQRIADALAERFRSLGGEVVTGWAVETLGELPEARAVLLDVVPRDLARTAAPYLSKPFVQADFDFYRAYLTGVKEQSPRWKRCVSWVDNQLGEFTRFPPRLIRQNHGRVRRKVAMGSLARRLGGNTAEIESWRQRALGDKPANGGAYLLQHCGNDVLLSHMQRVKNGGA